MSSLVPLLKHYNVTMEEDDNEFKINCQSCNVFLTCSDRCGELLNITFIHAGMSTLGLYPEMIVPGSCYFKWPARTKIQCIYQIILKEEDGDHK